MARPRIFVSHSSGADRCASLGCACVAHREAVVALLSDLGCDPVVDQDVLRVSDEWHRKLTRELWRCQGTVLLLSPHAFDSEYVMHEAALSVLLREATGEKFLVLPVLLPGAGRGDLVGSRLAQLELERLDMAVWASEAGPTEVADRLQLLVEQYGSLPHPEITEYLASRIKDVAGWKLSQIAELLGVAGIAYASDHINYVVSAGLLSERPVAEFAAPCAMRKALRELLPQLPNREHRQDVIDVVVPFARVPGAAAVELHELCDTGPEDRVAVLTALETRTAELYVRRASESPDPWQMHTPVPRPGMDFVESVITGIREFLVERFIVFDALDEDEVRRALAREEEESGPVTIVLGVRPDAELVRRLLAAFPRLLFLFAHADADVDDGGSPSQHRYLTSLTPGQERDMLSAYQGLRRQFSP
ncbi:toll/interleukin-1 receptor domain-containing protein [Streptomyces sp. NBC_00028]|uniref:toll/interleukin-1 receptor domain-containing protein n=1 Tax=Streptomyces sp. NBC_00028 TaxID=2975624 RepID=UPI00324EB3D1